MNASVTPIRNAAQILSSMDNDQLACRGQEHSWPKLRPGRANAVPRGFRQIPQRDGNTQIIEICSVCGKERTTILLGREYGTGEGYRYTDPQKWVRIPRDLGLTRRMLKSEIYRRVLDDQGKVQAS